MTEQASQPPAAPPVLEAEPQADGPSKTAEARRSASTGVNGAGFESRSDSSTLSRATQEHPDGIVARRSRSFAEKEPILRHPNGNAGGAEQAAPPIPGDDRDDEETDELFRQIREMALAFQAAAAPPVAGRAPVQKPDIDEFRRLLERGRARLPPAPPVT